MSKILKLALKYCGGLMAASAISMSWSANSAQQPTVPIKKSQSLPAANAALLKGGWKPRETCLARGDGTLENSWGVAKQLYQLGYKGIEICAGTGVNPCVFNYGNEKGDCLRVVTEGEYGEGHFPVVRSWSFQCPDKK